MKLYYDLINKKTKLSLIGLGYVGMPIAVAFSHKVDVIGYDCNKNKINYYKSGQDPTGEVGSQAIKECEVLFTNEESELRQAKFHIVAVPTPVKNDHTPDLSPVKTASQILGKNLTQGSIVVYESTVYPGVTEEICVPILEQESGLKCGVDFKVGYSPERINPGDKVHRLENIIKIVSGMDEESLDIIAEVYSLVVRAGVFRAKSIKVAEAAKVIENSQRDINIAFMNELSIIFNRLGIETKAVLEAAKTKWNFLDFHPGLVGGHCIGVDPYYLTYKAESLGYHSQIILSGRRINDDMGKYVAENIIKSLIKASVNINDAQVAILGFTFKENCPDTRNTKVIDIVEELKAYNLKPVIADPIADINEVKKEYGIDLIDISNIRNVDAIVLAVAHKDYVNMSLADLEKCYSSNNSYNILVDINGIVDEKVKNSKNYIYWSL